MHRGSTGSVFGLSNDELSPSSTTELMPVVTGPDSSNLEEAVREISREISSEFSCARDMTDPVSSPGQLLKSGISGLDTPCYELIFLSACIRCGYRVVE